MLLLRNDGKQPIRKFLLDESGLQTIIEMPTGWAHGTATQASVLFITADRRLDRSVKMFRFNHAESIPWKSLSACINSEKLELPKKSLGYVYAIPASQLSDLRLDAQYYDPDYVNLPVPDKSVFQAVKLDKLVEIRSGERFKEHISQEGIPFVQVGNISITGELKLRGIKHVDANVATRSRAHCQHSEILITVAGTVGKVAFLTDKVVAS